MKILIDMNLSPPKAVGNRLVSILREYEALLEQGALLTLDEQKARLRILPLRRA